MRIKPRQIQLDHIARHAKVEQPDALGFKRELARPRRITVQDSQPGTGEDFGTTEASGMGKVERKGHHGRRRVYWPALFEGAAFEMARLGP